jgi:predicted nucleic acid-binding protein
MSAYLLDARVLLNLLAGSKAPDPQVVKWLESLGDEDQIFASQITQAQLLSDANRQTDPIEREEWISRITRTLPEQLGSRLLRFGQWDELQTWALVRLAQADGDSLLPAETSLLVAVALVNDFVLVTRRTATLEKTGVEIVDPWSDRP